VIVGLDWFGDAPCTGVWALRSGDRAEAFLAEVWQQTDLIDHQWWEQAAVMRLIGWKLDLPLRKVHPSVWDDGTFILDERWDMLAHLPIAANPGYIRHYCDSGDTSSLRTRRLDMATEAARVSGDYPRYWLGRVEQWARPRYRPITGAIRFRLRALRP
jgi:hypothetical protein